MQRDAVGALSLWRGMISCRRKAGFAGSAARRELQLAFLIKLNQLTMTTDDFGTATTVTDSKKARWISASISSGLRAWPAEAQFLRGEGQKVSLSFLMPSFLNGHL